MNVDDAGRRLCPGHLEVGESDLILHQRGKSPVRWPLRSLRRYGFDAELFSFECGRRCPTGPGIYAFHCSRAEVLFNAVQGRVAARHEEHELAVSGNHSSGNRMRIRHSLAASSNILLPGNGLIGGLAGREDVVMGGVDEEEGGLSSYLEPIRLHHHHQGGGVAVAWSPHSRPLSSASLISSNSSPISPSTVVGGAGGGMNLYANNDILMAAAARVASAEMESTAGLLVLPQSAYVNLHDSSSSGGGAARDMDDGSAEDDADDQHHLYINVGPDALEVHRQKKDCLHRERESSFESFAAQVVVTIVGQSTGPAARRPRQTGQLRALGLGQGIRFYNDRFHHRHGSQRPGPAKLPGRIRGQSTGFAGSPARVQLFAR